MIPHSPCFPKKQDGNAWEDHYFIVKVDIGLIQICLTREKINIITIEVEGWKFLGSSIMVQKFLRKEGTSMMMGEAKGVHDLGKAPDQERCIHDHLKFMEPILLNVQ